MREGAQADAGWKRKVFKLICCWCGASLDARRVDERVDVVRQSDAGNIVTMEQCVCVM